VIILPTIGKDLNIPEARLQWILSAYSLTFGCFLLFWGRVGDIYGKRKIFIWGSAWFAVTTLVNPFLPNEIAFDLFRGLQGLVSIGRLIIPFVGKSKIADNLDRALRRMFQPPLGLWGPHSPPAKPRTMLLVAMVRSSCPNSAVN
jgi:MFS family permease